MATNALGQYELLSRIAHGGMAEIFLAKRRGPGGFDKRVVIKRVLPHLTENPEFVEMFLDEARLASRLSHPNIVQIFDFGVIGETYYLCMEHLDGEDLATVLRLLRDRGEPMPPPVAACILSAACDGMHYAHTLADERGQALKIVHRDLSPSNLFLTYQGAVKVLDFGVAKMEGKVARTQSGVVKGKFAYLSPEQALGVEIDARSDVFSLGIILYEALTATKVFKRSTEAATLRAVLEEPIAPPLDLRSDLDEELSRIVMKALARSPDDRFPGAQAMREALDAYRSSRASVPAAAQLQNFMKGILGTSGAREYLPTPTASQLGASQLGAVIPAGTEAGMDALTSATPPPALPPRPPIAAGPGDTAVERTPSAFGQVTVDTIDTGGVRQARGPRRAFVLLAGVALLATLIVGGWWASQGNGRSEATASSTPSFAPGPEDTAVEAAEANAPDEVPEPAPELLAGAARGSEAGAAILARSGAGARLGQAVAGRARKARKARDLAAADAVAAAKPDPAPTATGLLNINCTPWCRVYVDGRDTGKNSPAVGIKLAPGRHRILVKNPPTQLTREKNVTIVAGETTKVAITF